MNRKLVWLAAGLMAMLVFVLAALLLAANVIFANSTTSASATTASSRWPEDAAVPFQTVRFKVEGDSHLAAALSEALARELPNSRQVIDGDSLNLQVRIIDDKTIWRPFSARAELEISAGFSSSSHFSFMESEPTHFRTSDTDLQGADQMVQAMIQVELTDKTVGLVTRPAYTRLLAESLAQEIQKALQSQVFSMP